MNSFGWTNGGCRHFSTWLLPGLRALSHQSCSVCFNQTRVRCLGSLRFVWARRKRNGPPENVGLSSGAVSLQWETVQRTKERQWTKERKWQERNMLGTASASPAAHTGQRLLKDQFGLNTTIKSETVWLHKLGVLPHTFYTAPKRAAVATRRFGPLCSKGVNLMEVKFFLHSPPNWSQSDYPGVKAPKLCFSVPSLPWAIKAPRIKISILIFFPVSFSPTDQRSSARVITGQLHSCFLCIHHRNQKISHFGAAAGQRDTRLLYIHGTLKPWHLCALRTVKEWRREISFE